MSINKIFNLIILIIFTSNMHAMKKSQEHIPLNERYKILVNIKNNTDKKYQIGIRNRENFSLKAGKSKQLDLTSAWRPSERYHTDKINHKYYPQEIYLLVFENDEHSKLQPILNAELELFPFNSLKTNLKFLQKKGSKSHIQYLPELKKQDLMITLYLLGDKLEKSYIENNIIEK